MKKEEVYLAAQFLSQMKELANQLEDAERKKDEKRLALIKKEILELQGKVRQLL